MQLRRDGERLPLPVPHNIETAVGRGRGIIGMTLQFRADFEDLLPLEGAAGEDIQAMNHPVPHRHAASEAAGRGNVAGDRAGKWERLALGAFEEGVGRGANQRVDRPAAARNRDVVIEAKGDPEAIEPGSEIGRARRNSDGDLLHLVGSDYAG